MAAVKAAAPSKGVTTTGPKSSPVKTLGFSRMICDKFHQARAVMNAAVVERDVEIDIIQTALLIKEHVLLVGPPGCAKSLLLNQVMDWIRGRLFAYLMTKFSTPEELFGPPSFTGLKADKFFRVTTGKLPEADLAYIDEIFKGSPAILNTLLTIMNEGTFDDGRGSSPVPLRMLLASSNEVPRDDEGLNAMFDRFLFRRKVKYVATHTGRKQLLWGGNHKANFTDFLTTAELDQAVSEVADIPYSDDARKTMDEIVEKLRAAGISPSDRRLVKSLKIGQASAWLNFPARIAADPNAKLEVTNEDFEMMEHSLWVDIENHPQNVKAIVAAVSNPILYKINQYLFEAEQICQGINTSDVGQLAKSTTELKKLDAILKGLKDMPKHPRVLEAIDRVAESLKTIKAAMLD